jgi:hypothetical protein
MADEEIVIILKEKSDKEYVGIYNSKKKKQQKTKVVITRSSHRIMCDQSSLVTTGDSNLPVIQRNSMELTAVLKISSTW